LICFLVIFSFSNTVSSSSEAVSDSACSTAGSFLSEKGLLIPLMAIKIEQMVIITAITAGKNDADEGSVIFWPSMLKDKYNMAKLTKTSDGGIILLKNISFTYSFKNGLERGITPL
jgi:hypothetical protein